MNTPKRDKPDLPDTEPTPEKTYWNRRRVLLAMGLGAAAAGGAFWLGRGIKTEIAKPNILRPGVNRESVLAKFPATRNREFDQLPGDVDELTQDIVAATNNNFYEFTTNKRQVWQICQDFNPDPWIIKVTGLCSKPAEFDLDDLFAIEQEERTYRFRCVEAWAMDVPWTGYELSKLLAKVHPLSSAKFVRFISASDRSVMPGVKEQPWYPWPYFEALRMDEAMNRLTMLATGIYGRPLPRQHGAPCRLVVPWKYGFKSAKSIVRIELTDKHPGTFWNKVAPREYGFLANIDPATPHPRWSQATEKMLGTGYPRKTLPFGGYGKYVAGMY